MKSYASAAADVLIIIIVNRYHKNLHVFAIIVILSTSYIPTSMTYNKDYIYNDINIVYLTSY